MLQVKFDRISFDGTLCIIFNLIDRSNMFELDRKRILNFLKLNYTLSTLKTIAFHHFDQTVNR